MAVAPAPDISAERALRDTQFVEREVMRAARRAAMKVRSKIISSTAEQQGIASATVFGTVLREMLRPLSRAMAVSHVAGQRRAQLLVKQSGVKTPKRDPFMSGPLRFDVFTNVLKVLKRQKTADMGKLQKKYETEALKVISGVSRAVEKKLRVVVSDLIAEGATVKTAKIELAKAFDKIGLGYKGEHQLETVFRTQTQIAFNAGRWEEDQDPDIQEILWGYKYVTVGDDRVRDEHEALDGVTLPKDDPFWQRFWPPNGWNCRCQVIPIFEPRKIKQPKKVDGLAPEPDEGFNFNPGVLFGGDPASSTEFSLGQALVFAYNPDQPRNPDGTFGSGGSAKATITKAIKTAKFPKTHADAEDLKVVKQLPGSTSPELVEDEHGNQFVRKTGKTEGHAENEAKANELYEQMGVRVPSSQFYEGSEDSFVLNEFIEGKTLSSLSGQEKLDAIEKLKEGFVADALMGNWDVTGANQDNVLVTPDGDVVRIDNGGSMEYRAQGGLKGSKWNEKCSEIDTMRDPKNVAGKVYKDVTDEEIAQQVKDIDAKLAGKEIDPMVRARLNTLKERFLDKDGEPKVGTAKEEIKPAAEKQASAPANTSSPTTTELTSAVKGTGMTKGHIDKIAQMSEGAGDKLIVPVSTSDEQIAALQKAYPG